MNPPTGKSQAGAAPTPISATDKFQWRSIKTRVTISMVAILLIGILSLGFYVSVSLRADLQRLLGEQQFSTVSLLAGEVDKALDERLRVLEALAEIVSPTTLGNPAALREFLARRPRLQSLFNDGAIFLDLDGTAIAHVPFPGVRIGVSFINHDGVAAALKEGKSTIGTPYATESKKSAEFIMAAPVRDTQGKVIGALIGVIDLGKPNFLDDYIGKSYGKTGGYFLASPQHRLNILATDKSRIMQPLPAPGVIPAIDRFVQGYEGSDLYVGQLGVEILVSAKDIPVAGWKMVAALPAAEAFAPIHDMQREVMLGAFFYMALAGSLTWWLLRRELAPMFAAMKSLADLSDAGQYPQSLPTGSRNEIGQLFSAFNRLLQTLVQREISLKESEAFVRVILDSVADEIAVLDRAGMIRMVNQPWRRFALENALEPGRPPSGVDVGANYLAVCQAGTDLVSDGAHEAADGIRAVVEGHLPEFSLEYPCHSPQVQRWFKMRVTAFGAARLSGAVIAHTDITGHRQAEAELERLAERLARTNRTLEQANRVKTDFMATVTHELRTPLNSVIGFAGLLKDEVPGPLNAKQAQFAADIVASGERLLALVEGILEMSRLDATGVAIEAEPVEIGAALQDCLAAHRAAAEARGVTIGLGLAATAGSAQLEPKGLRRMLDALIDNAIKFNRDGGAVVVSAQRAGGALEIAVADTGIGIAREDQTKLFKPLVQLDAGLARRQGGIGLGLVLARRLAALHGGTIEVESELGKGSTFTLRLPAQEEQS